MNLTSTRLLLGTGVAAAMLALPMICAARPANTAPYKVMQPDGTEITVRLIGDENAHAYFTEDGYLLQGSNEEGFYYASFDAEGFPIAGKFLAHNAVSRSAAEKKSLEGITPEVTRMALEKRDLRNKEIRNSEFATRGMGLTKPTFHAMGEKKALVILVEFNDKSFSINNVHDYYEKWLNEEGFSKNGGTGSARDYFIQNSMGKFIPQFDLYGPVKLPKNMKYYGQNSGVRTDVNAHHMVTHAAEILKQNDEIDFSQYDTDGDGYVDNVFIIYAGKGENDQGGDNTVWPHSSDLTQRQFDIVRYDDVTLNHYACINELAALKPFPTGIGGFLHEFSHVIGLPDLYSTNGVNYSFTPGTYSILDNGSYNNGDNTPAAYSAYERIALEWMEAEEIYNSGDYELEHILDSNKAYRVTNEENPNEFYLFENRHAAGWDTYLPGHGLLVWHVTYIKEDFELNVVNNTPTRQLVDIIEADNTQTGESRAGDIFPGTSNVTSFGKNTKPAFKFWDENVNPGVELSKISYSGDKVRFHVESTRKAPEPPLGGVENVSADVVGFTINGRTLSANNTCEVYDMLGVRIATVSAGSSVELPAAGAYIVRGNNASTKMMIR